MSAFALAVAATALAAPCVFIAIFARAARHRVENTPDCDAELHGAGGGEPFHAWEKY